MSKHMEHIPAKNTKKVIQQRLIDELKAITKELGLEFDKVTVEVEKGAKKLVKILSRELKQRRRASQAAGKKGKAVTIAQTPAPKGKSKKEIASPASAEKAVNGKTIEKKPAPQPGQSKPKPEKKSTAKAPGKKESPVS